MLKIGDRIWPGRDGLAWYETGRARLMLHPTGQKSFAELVPIFTELQLAINKSRRFGDTEDLRNKRSQYVMALIKFCLENGMESFNILCEGALTPKEEEEELLNFIFQKGQNPLQLTAG